MTDSTFRISTRSELEEALDENPDAVEDAICLEMRARKEKARPFVSNVELFGGPGWFGDLNDNIKLYLLNAAEEEYWKNADGRECPTIDAFLDVPGVEQALSSYIETLVSSARDCHAVVSDFRNRPGDLARLASRRGAALVAGDEPRKTPSLQVGYLLKKVHFYVPPTHLTFDLSDRDQREKYVRLVQTFCWDLEDWTLDLTEEGDAFWTSDWEDDDEYTAGRIYMVMPTGSEILEAFRDWRFESLERAAEQDPDTVIAFFLREIEDHDPALADTFIKQKLPQSALLSYALSYLEMEDGSYEVEDKLRFIREAVGEFGYRGSKADVILELDRETFREHLPQIRKGKWIDRAPWRLVNLPPEELAYEGTMLRHCVGRFDMGYRERVENGEIQIWSLRDAKGRPRLTWEVSLVDGEFPFSDIDPYQFQTYMADERGSSITQLKGFSNRYAGEGSDEQAVLRYIFDVLRISPRYVDDFRPRERNPGQPASPWL